MAVEWFGRRLRELREAAGLTQQQLAEKAGMGKGGIAHLEQGERSPSWESVLALAAALGVECTAFTVEPAPDGKPGRGRPRKDDEGPAAGQDKPARGQ